MSTTNTRQPSRPVASADPDRAAKISAAKIYFSRVVSFIDEARQVHAARRELILASGNAELTAWWRNRGEFLQGIGWFHHAQFARIGAAPFDLDSPRQRQFYRLNASPEVEAALRKQNTEVAEFGMCQAWAAYMKRVADPATHPLPAHVTGGERELTAHQFAFAALTAHNRLAAVPASERLELLQTMTKSDPSPEIRDLAAITADGARFDDHFLEMFMTFITGQLPTRASAAAHTSTRTAPPAPTTRTAPPAPADASTDAELLAAWSRLEPEDQAGWMKDEVGPATFIAYHRELAKGNVHYSGDPSAQAATSAPSAPPAESRGSSRRRSNPADFADAAAAAWAGMSLADRGNWADEATFMNVRKSEMAGLAHVIRPG